MCSQTFCRGWMSTGTMIFLPPYYRPGEDLCRAATRTGGGPFECALGAKRNKLTHGHAMLSCFCVVC